MRFNEKVALLLLGLLVGGVAGYLTRPEAAEIRIGGTAIEFSSNQVSSGSGGDLTGGQMRHVVLFTFAGGIAGLLIGFALERWR
jgi:hypothetical protein